MKRTRSRRGGGLLFAAAFAAGAVLTACAARSPDATMVVRSFYGRILATGTTGAPTPPQRERLAPFLSAELLGLLERARAMHDAAVEAAPDEKPPFVEGSLFTSLFEGHTAMEVVADSAVGDARRITVRFTWDDPPPAVSWTDVVVVRVEGGRPVVADVEYGGDWPFANRGSLVAGLREALGR